METCHTHIHTYTHNVVTNPLKKQQIKIQCINVPRIITALTHFKAYTISSPPKKKHRSKIPYKIYAEFYLILF